MQAFIVIEDANGSSIRLPIKAHVEHTPTTPTPKPSPSIRGSGRWNNSYSLEFRRRAVSLGKVLGCGPASRELGIPDSTLDNWLRRDFKLNHPAQPTTTPTSMTLSWAVG